MGHDGHLMAPSHFLLHRNDHLYEISLFCLPAPSEEFHLLAPVITRLISKDVEFGMSHGLKKKLARNLSAPCSSSY